MWPGPVLCLVAQSCPTLWDPMDCSPKGFSVHGYSPDKNTGVGSLSLLQRIFPTQESNWGLLYCRWILYPLNYQESPIWPGLNAKVVLPRWLVAKNLPAIAGGLRHVGLIPGPGRSPGEGNGSPIPDFLIGESCGQMFFVGYSSWDLKELDMT